MNNKITNVLIINIERRADLLESIRYIFDYFGKNQKDIQIEKVKGIDGKLNYDNNKLFFNNLIANKQISLQANGLRSMKDQILGEVGCYLGHKSCWEKIASNRFKNTLILEDGIKFDTESFIDILDSENYDIIFVNKEMVESNNNLIGYGTQGYIVSYEGALKLLNYVGTMELPVDLQIRNLCNQRILKWKLSPTNFCERNNDRVSSINSNVCTFQKFDNIATRIIKNMIKKEIDLLDYI